ncbi:YdcF family protein [Arthrobacter sp. fls2-241-R2A-172]|uniref:YdcF family protein n=1 Tax=Arthrobacter sp. fls2-241-R2A-172 TaxID=3040325 RepID=UPI00254D4B84|nr:YdcF family protein [Arthrobacter sp. fls2-241-R2A-172]
MPLKTASATRVIGIFVAACFLAALLWLIAAFQFFYDPPQGTPHRTDAIVVLGGISTERLPVAQKLQHELDIPVLVVSTTGLAGNLEGDALCQEDAGDPDLVCFRPSPLNTRGEAEALRSLIAEHGWKSVTIVTSEYHLMRAGTLIEQCTAAEIQMVGSRPNLSAGAWLDRFVVETGGLIDAWMRPECSSH